MQRSYVELAQIREATVRELVRAVMANEVKDRTREIARVVRDVDRRLEEAADAPDVLLERRQRVVLGLGLSDVGTASGARRRQERIVRGRPPRVPRAGAGSRPAAGA